MSDLQIALEQISFARQYTLRLLDTIDPAQWFRQPSEGVSHIAWQVGHLATAEYWLALERIRGRRPEDEGLIPDAFKKPFGRTSVPQADPSKYPSPAEIRAVFDRVHEQTLRELPDTPEEVLAQPPVRPHDLAKTKRASLFWCAQHELVHAGQIGLLRRLLGYPPVW
jgi:uncharacterized damage-inducible protein DinB